MLEGSRSFTACDVSGASRRYPGLLLYDGPFDGSDQPIPLEVPADGTILRFNLRETVQQPGQRGEYLATFTVSQLLDFCQLCDCAATLRNGYVFLSRCFPEPSLPSTAYLQHVWVADTHYVIVVAFNETQPARYKAQLIGCLRELPLPSSEGSPTRSYT